MPESTNELLPALGAALNQPDLPETQEAAVRTIVVLNLLTERVKQRADVIRGWLADDLGEGGGRKIPNLGNVRVSAPDRQAVVTDPALFAGWYADTDPDGVEWVDDVDVIVLRRVVFQNPRLRAQLEADHPEVFTSHPVIPEGLAEEVCDEHARREPDAPEQWRLGPVADRDGELIPGLEVRRKARPTLTVTADPKARRVYGKMFDRLAEPAADKGVTADAANAGV